MCDGIALSAPMMFCAVCARVAVLSGTPGSAGGAGALEPLPQPAEVFVGPPVSAPSSGSALSEVSSGLVRMS